MKKILSTIFAVSLTLPLQAALHDMRETDVVYVETTYGTAIFQTDFTQPAGSGFLDNKGDVFLTLRANGTEEGYNTDAQKAPFDVQRDPTRFNNPLRLTDLNTTSDGLYYQFLIDINEPNGGDKSLISLDMLQFYTSDTSGQTTTVVSDLGTLRFDIDSTLTGLDSSVLYDDQNSGSGQGDIAFFIPVSAFAGALEAGEEFVYMYAKFGSADSLPSPGSTEGGFEEFWTASGLSVIPEMGAVLPFMALVFGALAMDRRRRSAIVTA